MTIRETEEHWLEYTSAIEAAQNAERQRQYARVVELAETSWDHIAGMLRHTRSEAATAGVELDGILFVLLYAPLVFDAGALDRLDGWLAANPRVARVVSSDLRDEVSQARERMWRAHALWDHLERRGHCPLAAIDERFSSDAFDWRKALDVWQSMQIVRFTATNGARSVRLGAWTDARIAAKCPHCGTMAPLPRTAVLQESSCPRCARLGVFVMVARG